MLGSIFAGSPGRAADASFLFEVLVWKGNFVPLDWSFAAGCLFARVGFKSRVLV